MTGTIFLFTFLQIAERLQVSVDTLGGSCADLVVAAGNVQSSPNDSFSKKDLSDKAKLVNENVSCSTCFFVLFCSICLQFFWNKFYFIENSQRLLVIHFLIKFLLRLIFLINCMCLSFICL